MLQQSIMDDITREDLDKMLQESITEQEAFSVVNLRYTELELPSGERGKPRGGVGAHFWV